MNPIGIMYHDIVESDRWNSSGFAGAGADIYKLSNRVFEEHLDILKANELEAVLVDSGHEKSSRVYITFDDGGESAHSHAADLLEKYGWRGHFFVATNYIGEPTFLKPHQIRDLNNRGHVIGSHSDTHPTRMAYCTRDEMLAEWTKSIKKLSDITGDPVRAASVPGGFFSRKVAETASESGIEFLFNSEPVSKQYLIQNCRIHGRFTVQRGISHAEFGKLARGQKMFRLKEFVYWNSKKAAKKIGGKLYLDLQRRFFEGRKVS